MNTKDQETRARRFRELHDSGHFVIANCWDAGSARVLASLGFAALATSSSAAAAVYGRLDHGISIEQCLENARAICQATDLPVSADLEKGFGDQPADVMRAIQRAAEVGLVGGSIEDASGARDKPIYDLNFAIDRVAAAAEAARALPFPFTLTARCENYLHGRADLDDTIRRLQSYERAGADVVFAPALPDLAAVRAVCAAVNVPVNFMVAIPGKSFSVAELAAAGVRRVSLAASLYRAAMTGFIAAAREVRDQGTFGFLDRNIPNAEFASLLKGGA
jgi:2-methylisocitrate lyase-like PEP mutase family enzyme